MVNETTQTKASAKKYLLIALMVAVAAGLGWAAYKNPQLFKAELTGGSETPPTGYTLYIPNDYQLSANESAIVEVKTGTAIEEIKGLIMNFTFSGSKILVRDVNIQPTDYMSGVSVTAYSSTNSLSVTFDKAGLGSKPVITIPQGTTLFRLQVELQPALTSGPATIGATYTFGSSGAPCPPGPYTWSNYTCIKVGGNWQMSPNTLANFREGQITVGGGAPLTEGDICAQLGDCSGHGYCNGAACVCDPGYGGARCNACVTGYIGYPECTEDIFANLKAAILTLSPDAISRLSSAERKKAYSSVYLIIKSSAAAGKTINLGGKQINLSYGSASTELTKIESIATNLIDSLEMSPGLVDEGDPCVVSDDCSGNEICPTATDVCTPCTSSTECLAGQSCVMGGCIPYVVGVRGSKMQGDVKGVVKLTSTIEGQSLDGITTTAGDLEIVPAVEYTLLLGPTASYKVRVIGIDQTTTNYVRDLSYSDLKWMPQPTNRLKSDALAGGLLERGDATGLGPVYVQIERASAAPVRSNEIVVEVPSGPIIEYVRVVGSGALERGSRANLSAKVSDVDTISDIEDIRTSIVKTTQTTVATINSDASAVWFTATPFVDDVAVTESGTEPAPAPVEGAPVPPTPPVGKNFKVYSIPVEIPQDPALVNGDYKLLLSLTDKAGHETNGIMSLHVGPVASGDVNGDGSVNMLDVLIAYRIAMKQIPNPTQAQLNAANLDPTPGVTMIDVILLYNKVNKK